MIGFELLYSTMYKDQKECWILAEPGGILDLPFCKTSGFAQISMTTGWMGCAGSW